MQILKLNKYIMCVLHLKNREINRENEEEQEAEETEIRHRRNLHRARRSRNEDISLSEDASISFDIIGKYVDWNKVGNNFT